MLDIRKPALVAALLIVALGLLPGCGKYDDYARNISYVSDDLLTREESVARKELDAAEAEAARASGGQDAAAKARLRDARERYAIVRKEQQSRRGGVFSFKTDLDERPSVSGEARPATASPAAPAIPATPPETGQPMERELAPAASPAPARATSPSQATPPAPVVVPATVKPATAPALEEPRPGVTAKTREHTVAKGQSLGRIARLYGVSEQAIIKANGLTDPDRLAEGKVLVIPGQ